MIRKLSNQPGAYNEIRVLQLKPLGKALSALSLPPARQRKLMPIFNALVMQVEDGGDCPEVNEILIQALRIGVLHQVDQAQAKSVLSALDVVLQKEKDYWGRFAAGDDASDSQSVARPASGKKIKRLRSL